MIELLIVWSFVFLLVFDQELIRVWLTIVVNAHRAVLKS